MKVDATIDINRPVEEVFAYVTDTRNQPEWSSSVLEASLEGSGPIGVGSRMKSVAKFLGRKIDVTAEVTEYDPNRKFSARSLSGPFKGESEFRFETTDQGTRLRLLAEGETGGLFKLADPVLSAIAQRTIQTDLHTLKDLLEAQVPSRA